MTRVFIGGSRRVSRLNADVRQRLDRIINKRLWVVVGDANGADKAVQQYLQSKHYPHVEVFAVGGRCRNNLGAWQTRAVQTCERKGTFSFYAAKDRAMVEEASFGFFIWDGKSAGTLLNCLRLLRQGKRLLLYHVPKHAFLELKSEDDWLKLAVECDTATRRRIERETQLERGRADISRQASLI